MASISTSTSTPPKEGFPRRLADLLQEQQEPFILEVHLLERGCSRKNLYSEGTCGCFFSSHSSKNKFFSSGRRRRTTRSNNVAKKCLEIAKALCNKLVSIKEIMSLKGNDTGDAGFEKEVVTMEESERLSFASFSTEFKSCSEGDVEDDTSLAEPKNQTNGSTTDMMVEWRALEENKQRSPDSVLDEIKPSPIYNVRSDKQEEQPLKSSFSLPKKPTEESIFSASMWDLLIRNGREKGGFRLINKSCSRYVSSKKALQKTKQLLFDCVREAVERQGRKQGKTEHLMEAVELGRIICNNVRVWERQSAKGSFEEWESFEGFREEIGKEMEDRILEEIRR